MTEDIESASNVIPFPTHLIGTRSAADGIRGKQVPTPRGSADVFIDESGMVLIDACVPLSVANRMLACL